MLFRKFHLNWRYGVSELAIVVAGVLIALAADGWRQQRLDRAEEFEYLQRLVQDLETDVDSISNIMTLSEQRAQYARAVLATYDLGRRVISPTEFVKAIEFGNFFSYPSYATTTIDDLTTTGDLRLIRDADVKEAISRYYATIEWTEQFSIINRSTQTDLYTYQSEFLPLDARYALLNIGMPSSCGPTLSCDQEIPWAPPELQVSEEEADRVLERLLARPEARSLYAGMARAQGGHYANLASIRNLANAALATIGDYIDEEW